MARRKHRGRFVQADLATADLSALGTFDTILVNSFLHHLPDATVDRILENIERRLDAEGRVHILELVLPERRSMARLMARLDRGRYARPLAAWSECFRRHFEPVVEEPYGFGGRSLGDDLLSGPEEAMRLSVGVPVFNEQEGNTCAARQVAQGARRHPGRSARNRARGRRKHGRLAADHGRGGAARSQAQDCRPLAKLRPSGGAGRRARPCHRRRRRIDGCRSSGPAGGRSPNSSGTTRPAPTWSLPAGHRGKKARSFELRTSCSIASWPHWRRPTCLSTAATLRCSELRWLRRCDACLNTSVTCAGFARGWASSRSASTFRARRDSPAHPSTPPGS